MKLFRYGCERTNRLISMVDSAIGIILVICCGLAPAFGVQGYLEQELGFTEFWADATVCICTILLVHLEQFVTYHIDKYISK